MRIDRLVIEGYKSFADKQILEIADGVTAIVGPNGCGKSNVVEALRFVQGESAAGRMRADSLDDVIFEGTDKRQPRDSAKVSIEISSEALPGGSALVSRRISRGDGSVYRIGEEKVRATDVRNLFRDAGAHARSMAHVNQGAVGALISAKPGDRRTVLEEAAGLAGLAPRRAEAETKLRAAEQNLERAEDLDKTLREQAHLLRRQARQAERKKVAEGLVRAAEALRAMIRLRSAADALTDAVGRHEANEALIAEAILSARRAAEAVTAAEAEGAPAREARMASVAEKARTEAELEALHKRSREMEASAASARREIARHTADIDRQTSALEQMEEAALEARDRLEAVKDDAENDPADVEHAELEMREASDLADKAVADAERLGAALAAYEAEIRARSAAIARMVSRLEAAEGAVARADADLGRARAELRDAEARTVDVATPAAAVTAAAAVVEDCEARAEAARREVHERQAALAGSDAVRSALSGEVSALRKAIGRSQRIAGWLVGTDMEAAAAAVVGDASPDTAGRGWRVSRTRVSGADFGTPLSNSSSEVPEHLAAAISGAIVVDDVDDVDPSTIPAGGVVVDRSGEALRWDGLRYALDGERSAEIARRARLTELDLLFVEAEAEAAERRAELTVSNELSSSAIRVLVAARVALADTTGDLREAERAHARVAAEVSRLTAREAALSEAVTRAKVERASLVAERDQMYVEADADRVVPVDADVLAAARAKARDGNAEVARLRGVLEGAKERARSRAAALAAADRTLADVAVRRAEALARRTELGVRLEEARALVEATEEERDEIPSAMEALAERSAAAGLAAEAAAAAAEASEAALAASRAELSRQEADLASLKETRAAIGAESKALSSALSAVGEETQERLGVALDQLPAIAGVEDGDELPDQAACEARIAKLGRERDQLGHVNPLAAEQLVEIEERLGGHDRMRSELRETVRRLRLSGEAFDREARERLSEAFRELDANFRELFERLFGGGHAHLALSGSDDPLVAGLELYACPPGKRMKTLSLMSGGEQALSALALIFAAFRVRPAPVCVLDEVDAALDDANTDKLCGLVAHMASDGGPRMLFVTHHPLTMARADRLIGVTMAERGVSRMVTMDLETAAGIALEGR